MFGYGAGFVTVALLVDGGRLCCRGEGTLCPRVALSRGAWLSKNERFYKYEMVGVDMKKGLSSKEIIGKIEKNRDRIRGCGVRKVGLFGSYLKGTQRRGSDIDILVEFDEVTLGRYCNTMRLFEKLFRRKIDLVIEKDLKSGLSYVKKEATYVKI